MTKEELTPYILKYAEKYGIQPEIVYGVCMQESKLSQFAMRFEPNYKWLHKPSSVRAPLSSIVTEETLQKFSFGLMQIMGGVLREQGFAGWLTEIIASVDLQVEYGCRVLSAKIKKYGPHDGILSYNSGSPIKGKDGAFINEYYYDCVMGYAADFAA